MIDPEILKIFIDKLACIPGVKHVDLWDNQVEMEEKNNSFPRPAVFIDPEEIDWTDSSQGAQTGELRISFHIVQETLAEFYAGSPDREKALKVFDLPNKVHNAMQRFSGLWFAPLSRVKSVRDKSVASQIIFITTYTSVITDNSGSQEESYIENANVSTSIGNKPDQVIDDSFTIRV